mmetsp:Transcript_5144/g.7154  ORF Transcript_5144/g.7154 Transcript_5144/m.7154 type:complete len:989 (-) Transcript_5144:444-3410(-)
MIFKGANILKIVVLGVMIARAWSFNAQITAKLNPRLLSRSKHCSRFLRLQAQGGGQTGKVHRFHSAPKENCLLRSSQFSRLPGFYQSHGSNMLFPIRGGSTQQLSSVAAEGAETEEKKPVEKFRKDYQRPAYWIDQVDLTFKIEEGRTTVDSVLQCRRNDEHATALPFELNGEELELLSLAVDGVALPTSAYSVQDDVLTIDAGALPASGAFALSSSVAIVPEDNTQLAGLYKSGSMYSTQCEAEGFRRITFFPDRPDVMAKYKVRIEAPAECPVLLSNGNPLEAGDLEGGRRFAVWEDPFPKPSYLFAMVAGDLRSIADKFTTASGREVHLEIFSEPENVGKLDHAMASLKHSMRWDEEAFGLEYDLDIFNIVAVNDFNMGAMENKGLNIFNTALVLADQQSATDGDYERIEGVVGHEYFHNWTGNRVTCRDWFQLTLKEGLTVFRDQEFSSAMGSPAVNRIENVVALRARQFTEDSGPMAHPIRPESYIAMDNFYTATVYSKGSEVIRMYQTLLGKEGFRRGMDLYFERHDGQAVSCDDFRAAMEAANPGADLAQFENWYLQAGTPTVRAEGAYDAAAKTYALTLRQSCPPTPGQPEKAPFHIPVTVGLLAREGGRELAPSTVLELREEEQTFTFEGVESEPVASVLRDFSAPVNLEFEVSDEDLAVLLAHDTDPFNKFEAGQKLYTKVLLATIDQIQQTGNEEPEVPATVTEAFRSILAARGVERSIQAYALSTPDGLTLQQKMEVADPVAITKARGALRKYFARTFYDEMLAYYHELAPAGPFAVTGEEIGRRRLRNSLLGFLCSLRDARAEELAYAQFAAADNMTDKLAAFSNLVNIPGEKQDAAVQKFYADAAGDALVLNKWFSVQAMADVDDALEQVKALTAHPDFTLKNPNRLRSLVSVFAGNMKHFHAEDGSGYAFMADMIVQVDKLNPQIASRLAGSLSLWRKYGPARQEQMKAGLQQILDQPGLSKDTYEIVSKSLA